MHWDGRSNRAIARDIGLSPPQVGPIVRAVQPSPGVFHDLITSVVVQVGSGAEMGVDDENCNGRAAVLSNETRQRTPQSERKPRNISEQTNESPPITAPTATSSVDNPPSSGKKRSGRGNAGGRRNCAGGRNGSARWGGTGVRRKANDGARLWYSAHMSREIPALADPADRERVHARMMAALEASPENQVEVLKDCLSTLFGVDIIRIIKYLGVPPGYYMETKQGNITIGKIDKIPSQPKFREAVMSVTNVLVPKVSGRVWEQRIQAILSACEDIEGGDANHLALETRRWVEDYLLEKPPREEDWEKAVSAKIPFVRKRATYMFVEDFQRWLELNVNLQLDDHEIGRRLRQIGMERKLVNARIGSVRTTRSTWPVPDNLLPRRSRQENPQENREENPPPMPGHHGADPEE